uniref:Uncharacterized protein n=1 Tax=Arundo donax TaxID=35708 RepID=A0A0A9AQF6_ARUDO
MLQSFFFKGGSSFWNEWSHQ